jgi:glycosyltransferase involved in cell wall biosynthesis
MNERLRVAVLSPIAWRTPPRQYGPWEQVASNTAEGLLARGHDVTLFATADSITAGTLEAVCPAPYEEDPEIDPKVWECLHVAHLMELADRFDIIHNHYDFLPLTYSRLIGTPMVTTIHGFSSPKIVPVYKAYNDRVAYVSISAADRHPALRYAATVYNGIRTGDFTFRPEPGEYLLFFGRIHPDKGTTEAIRIASAFGMPLVISGIVQDREYFAAEVEPHIDGNRVRYLGSSGPAERDRLLGGAYALLHPIAFEEPFGLSVAEAMLCGTPTVAYRRGSMPELIADGVTGFLVEDAEEAVSALRAVPGIDRAVLRREAERRFSTEAMVSGYLEVYRRVLG